MRRAGFIFCVVFVLLQVVPVAGDVKLPSIINENMVLQQKESIPIWGWADSGEAVSVKASWQKDAVTTKAGDDGKWKVNVKTPTAGGPYTVTIKGNNTISLGNVMIGEVWLCSGQSNMQMAMIYLDFWCKGTLNYEQEIAAADYPGIRLFTVTRVVADKPQEDCEGSWQECSPQTVPMFSAPAYFFGREIHKKLNVPVGLIHSSWGGTPAESWTRREVLESDVDFVPILENFRKAVENYPDAMKNYETVVLKNWEKDVEKAKAQGLEPPYRPGPPVGPGHCWTPSGLYNAMIAPLIPFKLQGAIWYQGESNAGRAYQYRKLFPAMIKNWRDDWNQGAFSFYYVQIAPWPYGDPESSMASELREAQLMTLSLPNTGMAVTTDLVDDLSDIHPRNKQDVGKRLALWALAKTYGQKDVVCSGPLYKSMKIEDDKIRLSFDYVGGGLVAKDGQLTDFTIAGDDKNFVKAQAVIDGDTIVVSSDKVAKPVAVRFGWTNAAMPNFFNKEGLPASPFRTDDWPGLTFNNR